MMVEKGTFIKLNPENGFFGVAPGTNEKSNPNALHTTMKNTIFTNVAHNLDNNTVWWEGLDKNPPENAEEWTGKKVNGKEWVAQGNKLAHPNSRFTAPACLLYTSIPSEELRKAFNAMQVAMSLDVKNTFGLEGTIAAYTDEGEEWMEQELAYLEQNMAFASEFVEKNMPGAKLPKPEGTFLGWLDLRGLGLSDEELFRRIVLEAAVICVPGGWFGPGGEGHIRLNAGCPRAMLQEALERIRDVLYKK